MSVWYNEIEPFAAAWLRELMQDGLIAPGHVDERDIRDVRPDDLAGFDRCHFFAGIGGWDYALQLAGWDGPVWTGSCPCQPFSAAGKGAGFEDTRHLWPAWFRLIRECRPPVVFGEQVASPAGLAWLDHVSADLEAEGYAVGAANLCAAGVGAPHIRQRLYFVAKHDGSAPGDLRHGRGLHLRCSMGGSSSLGDATTHGWGSGRKQEWAEQQGSCWVQPDRPSTWGFWSGAAWYTCRDGKARPTQPGLQPLAHGVPNRVGTLRGAGNAIVPQVAAEFVRAYLEGRAAPPAVDSGEK